MKPLMITFLSLLNVTALTHAAEPAKRAANTIILDETGVKNLRIETFEAEETDFESTVFALGRIQAVPGRVAALSSRIPGRIVELRASLGDTVKAGDEVVRVESRQPGDPPPTVALKAPIGGLVTRTDLRLGDPVEPSSSILEITDLSEVYAVARVPEHLAGRMKAGALAHIKVAALPDEKLEGVLLRFGTSADRLSGTIDAIFRLANTSGRLRADMRVEFSIVLSRRSGVVSVPRAALQGEGGGRFVYVKDFELPNAFIKTPVTVGEVNDRFVEITGGLLPSDEVVTRGAYSLSFAGAGSVSLKEALDAAHGHEHAEDGSELTAEKRAELKAAKKNTEGHHDHEEQGVSVAWKYAACILALLLMASWFGRKGADSDATHAEEKAPRKEEV